MTVGYLAANLALTLLTGDTTATRTPQRFIPPTVTANTNMKYLNILLVFILIGCFNPNQNGKNLQNSNLSEKTEPDSIETEKSKTPVDILKLLNLNFLETTSGTLSKNERKRYLQANETGFFGSYELFYRHEDKEWSYIGYLVVFTTDKPDHWRQDSKNQKFIEIELEHPCISIWDTIRVGVSEKYLMKFIGNNFHYKKGNSIYAEIGEYSCDFTIINDTINRLKVGLYNESERKKK